MRQTFLQGLLIFCGTLLMTACAGLPAPSLTPPTEQVRLGPAIERFNLSGRAMIRQGQRVDHLRFSWQRSLGTETLLITTPFGQGVARITRDATATSGSHSSRLQLADGRVFERESLSALASALFDTELPLDDLPEWLRGAYSHWYGASQGWEVTIEQIDTLTSGAPTLPVVTHLPRILAASRGDASLRLIIDSREENP